MGRLTRVLVALTRWALGVCALLAVLVALYVSLGRELVPLVAEYRADVESKAEQALGLPVHVGALEGRWSGLAPVLRVRDLQLGEGATALRLDDVKVVPRCLGQPHRPRGTPGTHSVGRPATDPARERAGRLEPRRPAEEGRCAA